MGPPSHGRANIQISINCLKGKDGVMGIPLSLMSSRSDYSLARLRVLLAFG
jgi:hypothetical protein